MANIGYIQLNRICNQKCLFCSNPDTGSTLKFSEFKKKVDDLVARKYSGVILTGGEPTLYAYLPQAIQYCQQQGIACRLITNGQKIADFEYLHGLVAAGLNLIHISLYSYKPQIQNYLSQNNNSFVNITKALENANKLNLNVNLNTVINKLNADHLDKTVFFIVKKFPFINHFIFNNLDPFMNRAAENISTIPKLGDFKDSLNKALHLLKKNGKSFRVERVPLCYMGDFSEFSTETRKLIKKEERIIHFLDAKGMVKQKGKWFKYKKGKVCASCCLNEICAGLYALGEYYDESELVPVKNLNLNIDLLDDK